MAYLGLVHCSTHFARTNYCKHNWHYAVFLARECYYVDPTPLIGNYRRAIVGWTYCLQMSCSLSAITRGNLMKLLPPTTFSWNMCWQICCQWLYSYFGVEMLYRANDCPFWWLASSRSDFFKIEWDEGGDQNLRVQNNLLVKIEIKSLKIKNKIFVATELLIVNLSNYNNLLAFANMENVCLALNCLNCNTYCIVLFINQSWTRSSSCPCPLHLFQLKLQSNK